MKYFGSVAVIFVIALCGFCIAQEGPTPQEEIPQPGLKYNPDLTTYSSGELYSLAKKLATVRQFEDAIWVGTEVLAREDFTKRADMFHTMAKVYEGMPANKLLGQKARDMYSQVLSEDPNYPQACQVALRLGELYDHILLKGTQRNSDTAIGYFKMAIDKDLMSKEDTIDIAILRCNVHLGNIYRRQNQYDKAIACFEAIYKSDPNDVVEERQANEGILKMAEKLAPSRGNGKQACLELQEVATRLMISACFSPNNEESMTRYNNLMARFPEDIKLHEEGEEARARYVERRARALEAMRDRARAFEDFRNSGNKQ